MSRLTNRSPAYLSSPVRYVFSLLVLYWFMGGLLVFAVVSVIFWFAGGYFPFLRANGIPAALVMALATLILGLAMETFWIIRVGHKTQP